MHTACNTHFFIDVFLNGIVIACINLVQINGVIDIRPHVVLITNMGLETLPYYAST